MAIDSTGKAVVVHCYPDVGRDIPHAERVLKRLCENGVQIILWTMRSDQYLQDAVDWFASKDIPLWGINVNPDQQEWTSSPKAYAQLYIDDAALGVPLCEGFPGERLMVDWNLVEDHLENRGYFKNGF